MKVYAGVDPVSRRRLYLDETIPPGPRAAADAEKARTRLLGQVDERRNPKTRATVNQLLDRYLTVVDLEQSTRSTYEGYIRNHIRPVLGSLPLSRLDSEVIDSFYAQLRTCRARCGGRASVQHWTDGAHDCDERCRPHRCKPMAGATVRQIHSILRSACQRAVKWRWLSTNPVDNAMPPSAAKPNPHPPSPEQAARISVDAWRDLDWGLFVWLAMITGARRGELCALTWERLDVASRILSIKTSIAEVGGTSWEKDTKSHQQRRIALDDTTVALLQMYRSRCVARAESLGAALPDGARMFSRDPLGGTWLKPGSVSQRYARMCARLGWDMNLHDLRHYSATELVAAGVDLRTIAGRLGHSGGGVTTLRVYSAWVPEADGRAARTLSGRLPAPPVGASNARESIVLAEVEADCAPDEATAAPRDLVEAPGTNPYERIASDISGAIACGVLPAGEPLPTMKMLAAQYRVSVSTAHRAVALLAASGKVDVRTGRRTIVTR
ncbi:MAG: tyrosine-type recombinase/integrase [Kineosporiaceae bacterium]